MFINEIENAIETGNYTEAIQLLQEVINNNPSDTEALNNLAVVLSILGEKDSAVRALNLVLQVDPQNEVALDNLKALAV
ncbi:MAG: tetratricopeptide repeat protein [Melioribacteraceae bacterium]|nr:MAG: tetratricopeptide repeat protein [Melioribacteraceae bacterium]